MNCILPLTTNAYCCIAAAQHEYSDQCGWLRMVSGNTKPFCSVEWKLRIWVVLASCERCACVPQNQSTWIWHLVCVVHLFGVVLLMKWHLLQRRESQFLVPPYVFRPMETKTGKSIFSPALWFRPLELRWLVTCSFELHCFGWRQTSPAKVL